MNRQLDFMSSVGKPFGETKQATFVGKRAMTAEFDLVIRNGSVADGLGGPVVLAI